MPVAFCIPAISLITPCQIPHEDLGRTKWYLLRPLSLLCWSLPWQSGFGGHFLRHSRLSISMPIKSHHTRSISTPDIPLLTVATCDSEYIVGSSCIWILTLNTFIYDCLQIMRILYSPLDHSYLVLQCSVMDSCQWSVIADALGC
jgi:hypothetical protein